MKKQLWMVMAVIFSLTLASSAFAETKTTASAKSDAKKTSQKKETGYVASKGGDKYHKPSCGLAGNIKPENKLTFKSKAEAEKAGYKPCAVCKP